MNQQESLEQLTGIRKTVISIEKNIEEADNPHLKIKLERAKLHWAREHLRMRRRYEAKYGELK